MDLQVDFCSPDGRSAGSRHSVNDMLHLPRKVDDYLRRLSGSDIFVLFTKAVVDEETTPRNLRIFRKHRRIEPPVRRGTGGAELCEMHYPPGSVIIEKPHFDAFAYTSLGEELKSRRIENVLVCGVRTEICVDATARRASLEGFNTAILRDLVATRDANREDGQRALDFFGRYYGYVLESDELQIFTSEVAYPRTSRS